MADDFILQTFRYRLSPEVLAQTTAFVLPFVWHQDLSDFMEDVYGPGRGGVPYERLNTVLTALIPGQIHPFAWVAGQRRMVTLRPAAERPTAAQIYTVIRIWAALAAQKALDDRKINRPDKLERLLADMDRRAAAWDWQEYTLLDAWTDHGMPRQNEIRSRPFLLGKPGR